MGKKGGIFFQVIIAQSLTAAISNTSVARHASFYSCQNKDYKGINAMIIILWAKTTPLIYASMKHFALESASLHLIPEKNVVNSQTSYFKS